MALLRYFHTLLIFSRSLFSFWMNIFEKWMPTGLLGAMIAGLKEGPDLTLPIVRLKKISPCGDVAEGLSDGNRMLDALKNEVL